MMKYPTPSTYPHSFSQETAWSREKSAERFAFQMIHWQEEELQEFGGMIKTIKKRLLCCDDCGYLIENVHCTFCDLTKRQATSLCIIASPKDVYAIEETGVFNGLYHVLETLLSPLDGMTPDMLHLSERSRPLSAKHQITEVIIALEILH